MKAGGIPVTPWGWIAVALLAAACGHGGTRPGGPPEPPPRRPNILVVVADDFRPDLMSAAGNPWFTTPNLDRLAASGARFANAFTTSGVCSPARASLLTGKYAHRTGVPRPLSRPLTFLREEVPFPARLHAAGYVSIHLGKWHLGLDQLPKPGYDHWVGTEDLRYYGTRWWVDGVERPDLAGHSDEVMAELAAAYIDELAAGEAPFVLYLGLRSPHAPFEYKERYADLLEGVTIPPPPALSGDLDADLSGQPGFSIHGDHGLEPFHGSWQEFIKSYYRSAMTVDDVVGTLMAALERNGIARDTVIVFTTDQGLLLGERGLTGKHFAYEQTLRVPLVLSYPRRLPRGVTRREIALNLDIAPTLLDLAGLEVPEEMDGRSLADLLEGRGRPWRDDFLFEFWYQKSDRRPAQLAVRTPRYKLIRYPYHQRLQLYDLERDPMELRDVAEERAYRDVLGEMKERLRRLVEETGWSKRLKYPVRRVYALGPLGGQENDQFLARLRGGEAPDPGRALALAGTVHTWERLAADAAGVIHLDELFRRRRGGLVYLAVPVRRLAERDPAALFSVSDDSGPLWGILDGEVVWVASEANEMRPVNQQLYNLPLPERDNLLLLATRVQETSPVFKGRFFAPRGSIELPAELGGGSR